LLLPRLYINLFLRWRKFLSLFESSRSNREDVPNRLKVSVTVDRYWLIQADTHLFSTKLSHAVSIFLSIFVSLQPLEIGIVCRTAWRICYFMLKLYRCNVYENVLQAKREREEWELSITNVFSLLVCSVLRELIVWCL